MLSKMELDDLELVGLLIDDPVVQVGIVAIHAVPLRLRYFSQVYLANRFRADSILVMQRECDALGGEDVACTDDRQIETLPGAIQCVEQDGATLDDDELITSSIDHPHHGFATLNCGANS